MHYARIFSCLAVLAALMPLSAYAADALQKGVVGAPQKNASAIPGKAQEAHDFFSYLVKSEVMAVDVRAKCSSWNNEPKITHYIQQPCASILRVAYDCDSGTEKHVADTHIDWRYVSEIKQSGYDKEGKEINISGNITTTYSEDGEGEADNMGESKSTQQAKIIFDSPKTAKRAIKAFALLKSECDTSARFSF